MTVAVLAESRPTATSSAPSGAQKRFRVATGDLQLGMWVAELDRPWLDTPFLLQGFLIDSQVELETLRKYCRYVYVDATQSSPELTDDIRRIEAKPSDDAATEADRDAYPKPTPMIVLSAPSATREEQPRRSARVFKIRADVQISDETRERFRKLVRSIAVAGGEPRLLGRAIGWLRRSVSGASTQPAIPASWRRGLDGLTGGTDLLPATTMQYSDTASLEEELPRARRSLARAHDALRQLAGEVRGARMPSFGDVRAAVDDLIDSMLANPDALLWLARLGDDASSAHHQGVKAGLYLIALGRHLGLPRSQLLHLGIIGMLADVGKARLPRAIIEKPGMLSPAEFVIVREHVQLALDALAPCALPAEIVQGIAQHHERLDGSGYPKGLIGEQISVWGRMAAVVDSFAGLTAPRPYATPSAPQDALMTLYQWVGSAFDERVVEHFVQAVGIFPVGSLVELSNGEIAVVVALNRVRRLEPRVLVLTWPDKSPLDIPRARDLSHIGRDGRSVRIVRGLNPGTHGLKLRDYFLGDIDREPASDD